MRLLRRGVLSGIAGLVAVAGESVGDTLTYQYDALGRVVRVTRSNGAFVSYAYDAAGNRREVIRSDNTTFTGTIQITGTGPVNLRTLANANGYTGAQNVNLIFQVGAAVTITGAGGPADGGIAIDTGTWSSDALSVTLALQVSGKVRGGGGGGGLGAGSSDGLAGAKGGDAVYCRENMSVTVNTGGEIRAGGGGGGGGGAWYRTNNLSGESFFYNGGGGGGGYPNGPGGDEGSGDRDVSNPGNAGTTSGGGAGGAGGGSSPPAGASTRINGAGGAGGGVAAAGSLGGSPTGTSTVPANWTWQSTAAGQGGVAGYAIRKNGKTVSVVNSGTISGTVG